MEQSEREKIIRIEERLSALTGKIEKTASLAEGIHKLTIEVGELVKVVQKQEETMKAMGKDMSAENKASAEKFETKMHDTVNKCSEAVKNIGNRFDDKLKSRDDEIKALCERVKALEMKPSKKADLIWVVAVTAITTILIGWVFNQLIGYYYPN